MGSAMDEGRRANVNVSTLRCNTTRGRGRAAAADGDTPRSLLAKLLTPRGTGCRVRLPRYCAGVEGKVVEGKNEAENAGGLRVPDVCSRRESTNSDDKRFEELSAGLGISISLVFLLTRSAAELNKIEQLRAQMEALLSELRNEMQIRYSSNNRRHCSKKVDAEEDNREIVDPLEAELEAELNRWHCGASPQQAEKSSYFAGSYTASGVDKEEEEEEEEEESSPPHDGVSARELERRLHELLHKRQHERIAELESALAQSERRLLDKEREVCRWRDAARLVSQLNEDSALR